MVERGEAPREEIGLLIGRRRRGEEADMLGVLRDRRQQGQRLEGRGPARSAGGGEEVRVVHVAHGIAIREEEHVELAALGGLGDPDRVVEVHGRVRPGLGMPPAAHMAAHRDEAGHQDHHRARPPSAAAA
jgi:hypothetical protein